MSTETALVLIGSLLFVAGLASLFLAVITAQDEPKDDK